MPSPTKNARRTVPDLLLAAANEANDDGNYARAYALFDAAFQLLPVLSSQISAANMLLKLGHASRALQAYDEIPVSQLSEKAAALVHRKRGEAQQAVAGGKDVADPPPSFSVDEVLMRGGQQANASGDTQLARDAYLACGGALAKLSAANMLLKLGDAPGAIAEYSALDTGALGDAAAVLRRKLAEAELRDER